MGDLVVLLLVEGKRPRYAVNHHAPDCEGVEAYPSLNWDPTNLRMLHQGPSVAETR